MEIKVYATLRDVVGAATVQLDSGSTMTVKEMLQALCDLYPALRPKLTINGGQDLHSATHILVNGRDMRYLNGLDTVITPQDAVRIFPPVGGGRW